MIAALALVAWQASTVLKVIDSDSPDIAFALTAPLPELGGKDQARLEVALASLREGSMEYTPGTIRTVTEGRGITCKLMPDSVLVEFAVPKTSFASGLSMMASLVCHPALQQESLDAALSALRSDKPSYWRAEMYGTRFDLASITRDEAMPVFQRVFKPGNLTLAVGGAVASLQIADRWADWMKEWEAVEQPRFPEKSLAKPLQSNPGGVTTVDLCSAAYPSDASLPARLLALYAIGCGKGSSLFRICRGEHGWSYRQEAYLWPSRSGWQSRFFIAMIPDPEDAKRLDAIHDELLKDVSTWTDADRQRALGMAEANLIRGVPFGPILVGDAPVGADLGGMTEAGAYWHMKTGQTWDPNALMDQLNGVDLAALKAAGTEALTNCNVRVLSAGS